MFGAVSIHLRIFIGQHNPRISDLHLRMHDPISHRHAKEFLGPECLPIEINRRVGILEHQIRSERAISIGNWLDHYEVLLLWTTVQCPSICPPSANNPRLGSASFRDGRTITASTT